MERDFEQEFRQLKQNEAPDLWNRIEAALPEKKIAAIPLEENKPIPVERYVPKKRMSWRNIGIIIAACLCVVILLPVMLIRFSGSASGSSDTSSAAGESGAAQWESSSETAEEVTEDAASADTEGVAGAEISTEAAASESAAEGTDGEMKADGAGAEEMEGSSADNGEMAAQSVPDLEDGEILEDVVVEILHVDLSEKEVFYEALVVQEDSRQLLEAGMEISIFCNAESVYGFPLEPREEAAFKTGERYTVTLCYQDFTLLVVEANRKEKR